MNKFIYIFIWLLAPFAFAEDLENISPEEYIKLEEKVFFENDINALNKLIVYNDYFSLENDALLCSAVYYYISANTNNPADIAGFFDRAKKYAKNSDVSFKRPFDFISSEEISKLKDGLVKDFLLSVKAKKALGKMQKAKINPNIFCAENKGYKFKPDYSLNAEEKKYYPLLALRGNTEALRCLKIIAGSAWVKEPPEYPFNAYALLVYIDYILSGGSSDFFAPSETLESEIYSHDLPSTDFLEKDDNILSKFILYHRYLLSGEIKKAGELKAFLESKKVDKRLLKSYILKNNKLVECYPAKSAKY